MRIEAVETLVRDKVAVVRVRTDDGVTGIGQSAPYEAAITAHVLHTMVAPMFLGRDPWDVEVLVDACLRCHYKFSGGFLHRAVAGIDTALWDVLGKVTGRPVAGLLGGIARTEVPVYGSSMLRSTTPGEEVDRLASAVDEHGYGGVKLRIGEAMGRDGDAAPGRTETLVPLARRHLGDAVDIAADANGGYTAAAAVTVGRLLEHHGYAHFEEPCPFEDVRSTGQVAAALDIPVAGGEQDHSLARYTELVHTVDIVQPDIGYIGGLSRARKVATLAEAAGMPCTLHCANDSLLQVFSVHLAAAMPACFQRQEWSIETTSWTDGIYGPVLEVRDGSVAVPTAPGWGIELDPGFLRDADLTTTR